MVNFLGGFQLFCGSSAIDVMREYHKEVPEATYGLIPSTVVETSQGRPHGVASCVRFESLSLSSAAMGLLTNLAPPEAERGGIATLDGYRPAGTMAGGGGEPEAVAEVIRLKRTKLEEGFAADMYALGHPPVQRALALDVHLVTDIQNNFVTLSAGGSTGPATLAAFLRWMLRTHCSERFYLLLLGPNLAANPIGSEIDNAASVLAMVDYYRSQGLDLQPIWFDGPASRRKDIVRQAAELMALMSRGNNAWDLSRRLEDPATQARTITRPWVHLMGSATVCVPVEESMAMQTADLQLNVLTTLTYNDGNDLVLPVPPLTTLAKDVMQLAGFEPRAAMATYRPSAQGADLTERVVKAARDAAPKGWNRFVANFLGKLSSLARTSPPAKVQRLCQSLAETFRQRASEADGLQEFQAVDGLASLLGQSQDSSQKAAHIAIAKGLEPYLRMFADQLATAADQADRLAGLLDAALSEVDTSKRCMAHWFEAQGATVVQGQFRPKINSNSLIHFARKNVEAKGVWRERAKGDTLTVQDILDDLRMEIDRIAPPIADVVRTIEDQFDMSASDYVNMALRPVPAIDIIQSAYDNSRPMRIRILERAPKDAPLLTGIAETCLEIDAANSSRISRHDLLFGVPFEFVPSIGDLIKDRRSGRGCPDPELRDELERRLDQWRG